MKRKLSQIIIPVAICFLCCTGLIAIGIYGKSKTSENLQGLFETFFQPGLLQATRTKNTIETEDTSPPVINLPLVDFQTQSKTISIEISSNEPLATSANEIYSIQDNKEPTTDSYSYTIALNNLVEGVNNKKLIFTDTNGNSTIKTIQIVRKQLVLYTQDGEKIWKDGNNLLAVIDKGYRLETNFVPSALVSISDYGILATQGGMQLRSVVIDDLVQMVNDIKVSGHDLLILSAYRSYQTQVSTYNYWLSVLGQTEADRASARPGHSEHQLGTTVDFTCSEIQNKISSEFGSTQSGKWLAENAYKYGFVMSYPANSETTTGYKHEPWHFRYVGKDVAKKIHTTDEIPVVYLKTLYPGLEDR